MRMSHLVNSVFLVLIVLSLLLLFGCSESPLEPEIPDIDPSFVSANTNFGFHLFMELVEQDANKNIFISPSSIAIALAMVYNGARGETQQEMAEVLRLQEISLEDVNQANSMMITALENPDTRVQVELANSIWAQEEYPFIPDFIDVNEEFYGAEVTNLDLQDSSTRSIINNWVSEETHGNIDEVVDIIQPTTRLFVINALYFKGEWTKKFDKKKTRARSFSLLDGSIKEVPMMYQLGQFMWYRTRDFEAVSIPYGSERVSMYIFLPGMHSSLEEFYEGLNASSWEQRLPQFREHEMEIYLPRFKLEYEAELKDVLTAMGMGMAFSQDTADFGGITPVKPFSLTRVRHRTFVEVNEEGTEAAAVTSIEGDDDVPDQFVVDRPFFCAIRDNGTGIVLFMGSIVDP